MAEVQSAMVQAWRQGVSGYQPAFNGVELEREMRCTDSSLANLAQILKHGLRVRSLVAGPNSGMLVTFRTGETYHATGFAVGYRGLEVAALAELAAKAGLADRQDAYNFLASIPAGYLGEIMFPTACHFFALDARQRTRGTFFASGRDCQS